MPIPAPNPPTAVLFTADDLTGWLGRTVTASRAAAVERVVWGWLKLALGLSDRPEPVPAEVFSWAVELGAIAHENPSGLSSEQLGPAQRAFSAERRAEILAAAEFGGSSATGLQPQGSFPPAPRYPDPAFCW